ncbi:hypothetical protein LEMLEM_LOCUS15365 [Lemmus lemmus]
MPSPKPGKCLFTLQVTVHHREKLQQEFKAGPGGRKQSRKQRPRLRRARHPGSTGDPEACIRTGSRFSINSNFELFF